MKMKHTLALAGALLASAVALMAQPGSRSDAAALPIARGPFQPTLESLQRYQCPEWFRDAKFGIWAHWGPQAVPMDGDWYARRMYEQGSGQYADHLAHYGHPSTNGYKDIIPLWKAEKFDPDRLMGLYKAAGARYFPDDLPDRRYYIPAPRGLEIKIGEALNARRARDDQARG